MPVKNIPQGQSINIKQIFVQVTCPNPECQKTYTVQMKKPHHEHSCRCGKLAFFFTVQAQPGKVAITVKTQNNFGKISDYSLLPADITIDTNE